MEGIKMDENALAKSDPLEDIQTHTDALLDNLALLRRLYPRLNVNWKMLWWACIYHDIGKLYSKFQSKVRPGGCRYSDELPHGMMSTFFIDVPALKSTGFNNDDIQLLFQAVAYHHERHIKFDNQRLEEEIRYETEKQDLRVRYERFAYPRLPGRQIYEEVRKKYFSAGIRIPNDSKLFFPYIMLKGMLNRLDYAASAHIDVENPNDFLCDSLSHWLAEAHICWNQMQCYLHKNADKNVIVIAQTGMGKTEGGLLWLGNAKGFFTLPLKSAINSIYNRVTKGIVTEKAQERVGLLHSETYATYLGQAEPGGEISPELYDTRTRQLSLPLTICTLDQIFRFVFLYRGFEERLATLSYSKIIIDEVQMYSPSLVAYLIVGLRYITKLGGHFAILTATLPSFVPDLLRERGISFEPPKVFVNNAIRHSIKLLEKPIDAHDIFSTTKQYGGATKILAICNTIKAATDVFKQLQDLFKGWDVHLLHSGFVRRDRDRKEAEIIKTGEKDSIESGVWVATQVVEASLDIDFDLLFTELSDLNGLFQRMGRCCRHRILSTDYNCFVFTGGAKRCSGVGAFLDERIHNLSKKELRNGIISEREKVEIVSRVYDKEQIPDYYAQIEKDIQYIQSFDPYDFSKTEAIKEFRDIHTVPVIPACIRKQYSNEINQAVADLQRKYVGIPKEQARAIRAKARDVLNSLTVDIPEYLARKIHSDPIYINDYESFRVADIGYNDEVGVIKTEKGSTDDDISNRMF